jgi:hypothetical protein
VIYHSSSDDITRMRIEIECSREDHDRTRSSGVEYFDGTTREIAIRRARMAGWSIRGGRHICPQCLRTRPAGVRISRLRPLQRKPDPIVEKPAVVDLRANCAKPKPYREPFVCPKCRSRLFVEELGVRFCSNCNRTKCGHGGYNAGCEEPTRSDHQPTSTVPGSREKIEVLRQRVELGQPLWHDEDRQDYAGMTGAIDPVDRTPRRVSERNVTRMLYSVGRKGLAE